MAKINFSIEPDVWNYDVDGNKIVVKKEFCNTALYVNDKMQDCYKGMSMSTSLHGKMPDGKSIKVVLGGLVYANCTMFVDNEMIEPVKEA